MKAIVVRAFGEPDVMVLEEMADPIAEAGQVVVRVRAVGVNPVDTYIRAGAYGTGRPLPYTPGMDAAGEVESVGAGVTGFSPGDRVYTSATLTGAYAEQVVVSADSLFPLPDNISFEQAAGINVPYATAYRALFQRAQAKPGETVLVHGASGGVGIAAVQLGVAHGLTVVGTAGTEEGLELVKREGASYAFNHRDDNYLTDAKAQATEGRGFDVILEMLANVNLQSDLEALAMYGRVVVIGNRGKIEINPRDTMGRDAAILGMSLFNAPPDAMRSIHTALYAGLRNGTLRPVVGTTLPLADAPRAHREILEGGAHGKIVLVP